MADIQVTDQGIPVPGIQIDLAHPSSLVKYLKTELLHLAVLPDFLGVKDIPISQVGNKKPVRFDANVQHEFELGSTNPEIDVTPGAHATIQVNTAPNADLFDGDPFQVPATIAPGTGYLSVGFQGSLDLGVSGSAGDLTFGLDKSGSIALEYWKAFESGAGEPTVGSALGQALSCFVIPADVSDLDLLGTNDIATVSGSGSLKISGAVSVTASPNPLASADLPLGLGTVAVKAGATAGLSAAFTISGSYQVRVQRTGPGTIQLSYLKEKGTNLTVDLSASAGIQASIGDTDLIAALLGAISTSDPTKDQQLLSDLNPQELTTLATAIKSGLDHSLQASLDLALSAVTDDQAAFQYVVQTGQLSAEGSAAVHRALDGDLTGLTEMEATMQDGGILAPGIRMLNSAFSEMRKRGSTLKLNLLGILNYLSVSELIRNSEVVTDDVSGDITIKETVTGNRINAIVSPLDRHEALRKAIFDSVLMTTSYRAGKAVALPELDCEQMHFALNQSTNHQTMGDYLSWFVALNLLSKPDKASILAQFIDGGPSTCILRTSFTDSDCASMFLRTADTLWDQDHYLTTARQALRALLDPDHQAIDQLRYRIVDDKWPQAYEIGANVNLGPLVGLSTADPRVEFLIGDVMDIVDWAGGMADAGKLVLDMRKFVGDSDVNQLMQNNEFKKKRDSLQKALAAMVKASKMRFAEPWGMVCLYWAGGSPDTAYGKASCKTFLVERGHPPALAVVPAAAVQAAAGQL